MDVNLQVVDGTSTSKGIVDRAYLNENDDTSQGTKRTTSLDVGCNSPQAQTEAEALASSTTAHPNRKQVSRLSSSDCVKVAIRIRPLLPLERQEPCLTVLDEPPPKFSGENDTVDEVVATSVRVGERRSGVTYTFDCVYGVSTTQTQLYHHSVVPLLKACLEGYNATILAYGQTGSGKTHTILGSHVTGDAQGVLPRTIHELFGSLVKTANNDEGNKENPSQSTNSEQENGNYNSDRPCDDWKVQVQFLEIYGEDIRDLLSPRGTEDGNGNSSSSSRALKVTIRDSVATEEPEVLGVCQPRVQNAQEALQMLQTGRLRRVTAATAMNATSSRSHALFTILVEQEWKSGASNGTGTSVTRRSKFHFVDLAGSERAKRTQAVGQRLKEGIEINKGLLVLGNVIAALASSSNTNKPFVPYRDSKLTRLLRGSLGGNHKTLMVACVSPSADNLEESLNCLRYANRAKQIENKAIINLDPTSQYITTLQQHIVKLAQQALFLSNLSQSSSDQATRTSSASKDGSLYTKEQLQALIGGESVEAAIAGERFSNESSVAPSQPRRQLTAEEPSIPTDSAEESLYWQKAQSSMHELLQVSPPQAAAGEADGGGSVAQPLGESLDVQNPMSMDRTVQKMVEYEREIGELKKALAAERSQRAMIQDEQSWVDQVQHSLQEDRTRLEHLQRQNASEDGDDDEESALVRIEAEADAEQATLTSWTKKYTGDLDVNDGDVDDDESVGSNPDLTSSTPSTGVPSRHHDIQQDLMELARSIAAKEELIGQLKTSQERYEHMREFYEAKLKEMEHSLMEKEEEREILVKKLADAQKVKAGGIKSEELKEKLRQKEAHIATLKQKSVELRTLTTVSSRNAMELSRLTRDVEEMKRRKVDLQRQLVAERKDHATQIKRLQKEAMQKERELNKYKRLTSKKEMEADKANQVAKSRLEELGTLRLKFKDTEKKLRLASVRRGVMAKAGLDPVLVGQRDKGKHNIDTNALRDLFDEKVSKVARKEALVNKLAMEWEQHFQLTLERNEVTKNESFEEVENIELQLKYKEDRIRNLAKCLEEEGTIEDTRDIVRADKDSFLFDAQYDRVCKAAPPDVAHKSVAKVLFGMVVRERRRVGALARTACSLDERLQTAVEDSEAKDLALRSYVDEQREQVAEMSQNQQNQILSLMELVKVPTALKDAIDFYDSDPEDSNMSEPEWANEIMEDLALIADGKIPPSLKGSLKLEEKQEVPVFERLANPENYTGTQKQAQLRNKSRSKGKTATHGYPDVTAVESEERPAFDDSPRGRHGPGHFGRDGEGEDKSKAKDRQPTTRPRTGGRALSGHRAGEPKSALSRLASPERRSGSRKHGSSRRDENASKATGRDRNRTSVTDPGEESVFERLSNQTTFAFSIRQNGAPEDEEDQFHHQQQHQPRMTSVDALLDEVLGSSHYNGHSSPDVFERLTKTTTEAYAMKVNRSKEE